MIKLTITEKGGEPRALSFDQSEVSIGRVQGNDIVLPKGNISKRHTKLSLAEGRMTVSDSKSTNGTYVNGRKIAEPTPVRPGDKIFVGDFLIVIDPAAAAAETSGARRGPPPPPPPPPRPGTPARPIPSLGLDEGEDNGSEGFGDLGDGPPSAGRGRPPAPPPPPPLRRTIVTSSLQDDSADIGEDEPPPSPADIGARSNSDLAGDVLANLGNDMESDQGGADLGSDVFGSHAAEDEDADLAGTPMPASRSAFAPSADGARPASVPHAAPRPSLTDAPIGAGAGGSLETLLADPTVTAIVVAGASVQVERGGKFEPAGPVGDGNAVAETVWQIANTAVPPPPADNPVVDVRLVDGTRVTALFPPITNGSVSATLRKATVPEVPLADIAGSADVEKILTAAVTSRRNILLCGDGPACSTLAGALAGAFPADRRVVSIGAGVKSRPGWIELGPGNDPAALVRAAVAFRADHLLVADGGGPELPELLLAAARGQEGIVGTMAARSAPEALARLRAFAVGAVGAAGFAALVASGIDLIVLAATTPAGTIRVVEMAEPQADGEVLLPAYVARRSDRNRSASIDISGVSTRLAAAIAVVTDGLPAHLIHR